MWQKCYIRPYRKFNSGSISLTGKHRKLEVKLKGKLPSKVELKKLLLFQFHLLFYMESVMMLVVILDSNLSRGYFILIDRDSICLNFSFHRRPEVFFFIFQWIFSRNFFELFIKVRKSIKSAFITNLCNIHFLFMQ